MFADALSDIDEFRETRRASESRLAKRNFRLEDNERGEQTKADTADLCKETSRPAGQRSEIAAKAALSKSFDELQS